MKIFLTGITGFLGKVLSQRLIERGHEVSGLVRYVSNRDVAAVAKMLPDVEIHWGDLTDLFALQSALKDAQPEIVVHLASQSSVEFSFDHILEIYQADFLGTVNLALAAMQQAPELKKFIYASTMECYGNQPKLPLTEDMAPNPASPYGIAKVAGENHLKYLYNAFKFPVTITRCANMHGRVSNTNFVVERIITELLAKHEEVRMGIPDSMRDFMYVDDGVDFYVKLIKSKKDVNKEIINAKTDNPISIAQLFMILENIIGFHARKVLWNTFSPRPFEIKQLTMDIAKAKRLLRWEPKTSLEDGLRKTVSLWREAM